MAPCCTKCQGSGPNGTLRYCRNCALTLYCSQRCQHAHWWDHKRVCGRQFIAPVPSASALPADQTETPFADLSPNPVNIVLSPPRGLNWAVAKPFTRLSKGTWMQDRPEIDVYRLLIDTFRLHLYDMLKFESRIDLESDGLSSDLNGKRRALARFLKMAAQRPNLLPPWWTPSKRRHCEEMAVDGRQWHSLPHFIRPSDIIEHYGDMRFHLQLRMFAEAVMARGPGGYTGAGVRTRMVQAERCSGEGFVDFGAAS